MRQILELDLHRTGRPGQRQGKKHQQNGHTGNGQAQDESTDDYIEEYIDENRYS